MPADDPHSLRSRDGHPPAPVVSPYAKFHRHSFAGPRGHCAYPSLCIPRIVGDIREEQVHAVMSRLGLGAISHVSLSACASSDGSAACRAFIHFRRWSTTETALAAKQALLNGECLKVMCTEPRPCVWRIFKSKFSVEPRASPPKAAFDERVR